MEADREAKYIGPIHDIEGFGDDIELALTTYFETSRCAILTCNEYSFGMVCSESEFWIFDSHAKDKNGKCDPEGFGVLINFTSVTELVIYLRQNFNNTSTYSITEIKFQIITNQSSIITCQTNTCSDCPLGDSVQNQPGSSAHKLFRNQPGCPLGDFSENQPGYPLGDSSLNIFHCPLGDFSQNQPGHLLGDSSLNILDCSLGDSFQSQPVNSLHNSSQIQLSHSHDNPLDNKHAKSKRINGTQLTKIRDLNNKKKKNKLQTKLENYRNKIKHAKNQTKSKSMQAQAADRA